MNYNEIIKALELGQKVHWSNTGYKVFLDNGRLYTKFIHNDSMCGLQESEYQDCFIGV